MPAKAKNKGWQIESAIVRSEHSPETFKIPSKKQRENVEPGYVVKLIFTSAGKGERMWVEVEGKAKNRYVGILKNSPIFVDAIKGERVEFGPENICAISPPEP